MILPRRNRVNPKRMIVAPLGQSNIYERMIPQNTMFIAKTVDITRNDVNDFANNFPMALGVIISALTSISPTSLIDNTIVTALMI